MISVIYVLPDGTVRESFEMADGMTLDQAARAVCPDTAGKFPAPVIAIVGDRPAVRKLGDWDCPLSDARVQFRQLALGGGGGSNALQVVLQLAIVAAAIATQQYVAGLEALGESAAFFGGLAGATVLLVGSLALSALFPQGQLSASSAESASPTYSINSSGNQARLYQTEPEGFGRMKITPDFVAQTWTEYVDNDQIGYFVYSVGRGLYDIEALYFGETLFWSDGELVEDSAYEIQDIQIVEPGEAVTIFPDNVVTSDEVSSQELFGPNDEEYDGAIGPYTTNPAGTVTNKLLFDFVFQSGIGTYDDSGNLNNFTVTWNIEYQEIDDYGTALSEWAVLDTPSVTAATLTPQRITKTYSVAEGRYSVRVVRTSDTNSDGRTLDTLYWGALRAMLPGTYTYPITCVAFSVKANNALTQAASTSFSLIATRKLPLYDRETQTWSEETATRSWAAAVSHVCKSEWGGRVDDANIDLDTLWAIDEKLQAKGWYYDSYIDGAYLVWTLLVEMCQSQCVIPRFVGPVLSFVLDEADREPSFALTPRNIVRNSFSVTYATWSDDTPDDVTMEYLDADYGFQQRDVTATLPESESSEPASLDMLGITNRDHAFQVAVAYAAHNRWQRVSVECQTEALGRIVNRGDVCTVAHPRFKNTAAGAVTGWDEAALTVSLHQDFAAELEADETSDGLYLALTRQDGSVWGPCLLSSLASSTATLDSADYATLLLQGQENPFEWLSLGADRLPTTWTLYTSKTYQRLMIVDSVQTQDALHYTLKLLNYDARIYQYGELETPAWEGRGQLPTVTELDAPDPVSGIVVDENTVTLVWAAVDGVSYYEAQTSADGETWIHAGRSHVTQLTVSVGSGVIYARVRAVSETLQSVWATWSGDTTVPAPDTPVPVLAGAYDGGEATISWAAVDNAESYLVGLVYNSTNIYTSKTTATSFEVTPEIQTGGPYRSLTVTVCAVGANGSSAMASLALSDPAPDAPESAEISVSGSDITLESVTPDASDGTGYVILRGETASFTASEVSEMKKITSLPYTWSGFDAGTYYFRVAVRDAFFDLTSNLYTLNWSGVLTVEIEEE